jgi:hypothetical protein
MSELILPPPELNPELPQHMNGEDSLGFQAIVTPEQAFALEMQADNISTRQEWATSVSEQKIDPRPLSKLQIMRRKMGSATLQTPEEIAKIEEVLSGNLDAAELHYQSVSKESEAYAHLTFARAKLLSLNDKQKEQVSNDLLTNAPDFFSDNYVKWVDRKTQKDAGTSDEGKDIDVIDWLTDSGEDNRDNSDIIEETSARADRSLTHYLEWNDYRLTEQIDPSKPESKELLDTIYQEKQDYKGNIIVGVDQGWLNKKALEAVGKVDNINVHIGDIYSTDFREAGGYHRRGTPNVVIQNGNKEAGTTTVSNTKHALQHELNHAVLGQAEFRWIDEALTEHIALSLKHGEPKTMLSWERQSQGAYPRERNLLATLLSFRQIPVSEATRMYSAKDEKVTEEFNQLIDKAWGVTGDKHAIEHINEVLVSIEANLQRYDKMSVMKSQAEAAKKVEQLLIDNPQQLFSGNYKEVPDLYSVPV